MRGLGLEVTSVQVARLYSDFLDTMVIDVEDAHEEQQIIDMGLETLVLDTVMSDNDKASNVARFIVEII